eukprot:2114074-Lingulodinium_polyedra.AAC.1
MAMKMNKYSAISDMAMKMSKHSAIVHLHGREGEQTALYVFIFMAMKVNKHCTAFDSSSWP